jgi:hypothetical protein
MYTSILYGIAIIRITLGGYSARPWGTRSA